MADEYGGLAIVDMVVLQVRGSGDDKQLVVIDVDLGQLVALDGVLHGQRVQPVAIGEAVHFLDRRVGDADPDELAFDIAAVDPFVDRHRPDAMSVTVEIGGDDGHARFLGRQGYRAKESFGAATRRRIKSGSRIR